MSFRGRPSRGCAKCRSRKVKCDEALPACRRCVKGGFECQYRDSFDLFFRNQTSEVAQKAQEKWRSRAKRPQDSGTPTTPSIGSAVSPMSEMSDFSFTDLDFAAIPPLPANMMSPPSPKGNSIPSPIVSQNGHFFSLPPQMSLIPFRTSHAYHRFFFDFCVPAEAPHKAGALFGFLPELCKLAPANSVLHNALSAAAYANYAGRYGCNEAALAGAEQYGKTLKKLASSMGDVWASSTPDTLVAMCVMGIYELVTSADFEKIGSWVAHTNGATALMHIKSAQEKSPTDPTLSGIYCWIFSQMLIKSLTDNTPPKMPLPDREAFIGLDMWSYDLMTIMYEVSVFCARWKSRSFEFLVAQSYDVAWVESMIVEGQALDARLQCFPDALPKEISYSKVLASTAQHVPWLIPLIKSPGAPEYLHRYKSFQIAAGWNSYRTTRLVLNGNLMEIAKSLKEVAKIDTNLAYRRAEYRIIVCTDEICEGTLACFADHTSSPSDVESTLEVPGMRGYAILWPLFMAGMYITWAGDQALDVNSRSQWIKKALSFVHKELGINKALAFLDTINKGVPSWHDVARKKLIEDFRAKLEICSPVEAGGSPGSEILLESKSPEVMAQ